VKILWSSAAWSDATRLYLFMAQHDLDEADALFDTLAAAPSSLLEFPKRGSRLSEFGAREVREFRIGRYLLRYELTNHEIRVLRLFHARESRF
jgi:plasmid stabilization system protein ParE